MSHGVTFQKPNDIYEFMFCFCFFGGFFQHGYTQVLNVGGKYGIIFDSDSDATWHF